VDNTEATKKALEYAETAFAPAIDRIAEESARELRNAVATAAARGAALSGGMSREIVRILCGRIGASLQARADALLEGFELYGVPVNDEVSNLIYDDVCKHRTTFVAAALSANRHQPPGLDLLVPKELERASWSSMKGIKAHIERTRLMRSKPESATTNVYHVYGHNAPSGEEQIGILDRLQALEDAQSHPWFAQRYTDFIASAANHMTILAPFIPALTEMLRKALAG
jgi:hypothetical protein